MKGDERAEDWLHGLLSAVKRHREYRKQRKAERDLQRIVDETRESYETRRYRERRSAALKSTRGAV